MSNTKHYIWSAVNRIGVQILGFIGNILIARLLSPDDYGLIAMLSIILGISWNLTESGFADSLIRKQDADKIDYGTILTHNVSVSIILYIILYFSAPLIARFFERDELIIITRIISLSIVLKALTVTEFTRMRKQLEFKKFAIIQLLASFLSILIAYVAANNGFGYYALVVQTISLAIFNILLMVIINKWVPVFYFNVNRYKEMRKFSNNMLLSYFTNQIGQNIYSVFIGKFYFGDTLGFFNQATKINDANYQGINAILLTTSYPIIAKEKDKEKRRKLYIGLLNHFLFIQYFFSFLVVGSAHVLILFLFGDKWVETTIYLQMITISFLFYPVVTVNQNIVKTENKTNIYRNLTFLRNGLTLLSLLLTFRYSMNAILIGLIIARFVSVYIDMLFCGKHIDFSFLQQSQIIAYQIVAPFLAMLGAYFVSAYFETTSVVLFVYLLVYFILFIGINFFLKNYVQYQSLLRIIKIIKK